MAKSLLLVCAAMLLILGNTRVTNAHGQDRNQNQGSGSGGSTFHILEKLSWAPDLSLLNKKPTEWADEHKHRAVGAGMMAYTLHRNNQPLIVTAGVPALIMGIKGLGLTSIGGAALAYHGWQRKKLAYAGGGAFLAYASAMGWF